MNKNCQILFLFILFGVGCTSSPKYMISPEWDKEKLAKVYIYRTTVLYHSLNPEKPFFYLDGMEIGKLGTGEVITIEVPEGKHTITVREPFLFMPSYENGRLELQIEQNQEYYVRYSKDFSGVVIAGDLATTTGETTIQLVDKEQFLQNR